MFVLPQNVDQRNLPRPPRLELHRRRILLTLKRRPSIRSKCKTVKSPKPRTLKPENLHFNITGIQNVMSSTNIFSRLLWVGSVVVFYAVCVFQLVDRITTYLNTPISLEQTVAKYDSVQFPAITVCPADISEVLEPYCKKDATHNNDNGNFGPTLEKTWAESGIPRDLLNVSYSCVNVNVDPNARPTCKRDKPTVMVNLLTMFGNCTTIYLGSNVTYRGAETFFAVTVDLTESIETSALFILHKTNVIPIHEAAKRKKYVSQGYNVDVRFTYRMINFLSTKKHPCLPRLSAIQCTNDCMNKFLDKYLKCRLPFMVNSSLPICHTMDHFCEAYNKLSKAYTENDGCHCHRSCKDLLLDYSFDSYLRPGNDTMIKLTLLFPDNLIQSVTQTYRYTIASLLSDAGGSLGICVGLCLFNFVELFEHISKLVFYKVSKKPAKNDAVRDF